MGFYKYSLTDLVGSAPRVLIAPSSVAVPVASGAPTIGIEDIIDVVGPDYEPKTGWIDLGGAREGSGASYSRGLEEEEWRLEQTTGAVATDITDVPRTITANISEFSPTNVRNLIENAPAERAIAGTAAAGVAGNAPQTAVDFGTFTELERWRVAIIGQGRAGVGADITETGNGDHVRGPFKAIVLFSASLAAEEAEVEVSRGQPAVSAVTFRAFPESTITDTERDRGTWLHEIGPATIAIA